MRIPDRFRDPVAIAETFVFGVGGVLAGLFGPLPWLAAPAGLAIAAAVFVLGTWRKPAHPRPAPDPDPEQPPDQPFEEIVRGWEKGLDDPDVRKHAESAVASAGEVDNLIFQCGLRIKAAGDDGAAAEKASTLDSITEFLKRHTVYQKTTPTSARDWDSLEGHVKTAREELEKLLKRLERAR